MILFAADNHYSTNAGRALFECIEPHYDIRFYEDNWDCFNQESLADQYSLLILNLISGSCNVPVPGPAAEKNVYEYVRSGGFLFLLHGASAAFWQWDWWRALTGFRWVREDDPDGFNPSCHPVRPYRVEVNKCRHPLCQRLQSVSIPEDELYIDLEQTCPAVTLMATKTDEGSFPMCYETITTWGGRIVGYIPGHAPHVVKLPKNIANCRTIIDWLLVEGSKQTRDNTSKQCATTDADRPRR